MAAIKQKYIEFIDGWQENQEGKKMVITLDEDKQEALARYLECTIGDLSSIDENDYLVLTDEEADEKAKEYIEQSVWAFNKSFLDAHSDCISKIPDDAFKAIQEKCESANDAILAMIDDFDHFVEDAIKCGGRGHFMSSYDGEEAEYLVNGTTYYVYRLN